MKITEFDGLVMIESDEGRVLTTLLPSSLMTKVIYLSSKDDINDYVEVDETPIIELPEEPSLEEPEEVLNGYTLAEAYYTLMNENRLLKEENELQNQLIDITMMATDEMFSLIEPMLSNLKSATRKGVTPMVEMYVAMVQRGLKTIDEVPARYRAEVERILKQLEA